GPVESRLSKISNRLASAATLVVALAASFAGDAPTRLTMRTSLSDAPSHAHSLLDLPAGTPVEALERSGDWVRVRVEGWVPLTALPEDVAVPTQQSPSAPSRESLESKSSATSSPPGAAAARGGVEGTISLDAKWLRKRKGAGAKVWLVPADAFA